MGVCGGFIQTFGNPSVEAFTRGPSGDINLAVQIRGEAQHELAGKRFFRGLSKLGAKVQVVSTESWNACRTSLTVVP